MNENHRGGFGGRQYRSDEDRQRRYGRFGSERAGRYDWDDDRTDWRSEGNDRPGGYGSRQEASWDRQQRGGAPQHHDHDDHHHRGGFDRGADDGRQPYFTGQQSSWAVPPPRAYDSGYAGGASGGFGRDYREHGYGSRDDGDRGFLAKAGDEIASWFGDEDAARRREADHRGRGPKDYVRSDERIRDDVNDRLTDDWRVDASNITVSVENGEVTLNGSVTAREAKRRAEDIVEDVSGVKHVQNNLRVQPTGSSSGGAYGDNWALNQRSTAEGGTLGKDTTPAKH